MTLLIIIGIVLLIITASQFMKIADYARALKSTKEYEVTENDNKWMGRLMLGFMIAFFIFCIWQLMEHGKKALPESASEHGLKVDWLMNFNLIIITIVFVITNFFLFYFAWKYYGRKDGKATYVAHNNKLEMIWTVIPAIALAIIISYGIAYWNDIMAPTEEKDPVTIELYSQQFAWTARYAGKDKVLGNSDFRQISTTNAIGVDTNDMAGHDDLIIRNEFHIPKGKEVVFKFRSKDVIHSAFMPHFRAQMNCVPGQITSFKFKPILTTKEMRAKAEVKRLMAGINTQRAKDGKEEVEFDYVLLCNKICGASHYNMQMTIVVDEPADYQKWIDAQASKAFKAPAEKKPTADTAKVSTDTTKIASK
jgi:cytochrome c oxidase subunit II